VRGERLTQFSLFHLFSREGKNRYEFGHNFDNHFGYRRSRMLDLGIDHESPDKSLDAFENLDEGVIAFFDRVGRLVVPDIKRTSV